MRDKEEPVVTPPFPHQDQLGNDSLSLAQLNKELEDCRDQLKTREKELAERFDEVAALTQLLLETDNCLDSLVADLNDRNQNITEITVQSNNYFAQLSNLSAQLFEISKIIDDFEFEEIPDNNLLTKIEFLCRLNRNLAALLLDRNQQIEALHNLQATLQDTLELRNQTLNELSTQIDLKDSQIETLRAQNTLLKENLNETFKSTSWRVTAPLRYIKKLLGFTAK